MLVRIPVAAFAVLAGRFPTPSFAPRFMSLSHVAILCDLRNELRDSPEFSIHRLSRPRDNCER
jgi:hypothetical protein